MPMQKNDSTFVVCCHGEKVSVRARARGVSSARTKCDVYTKITQKQMTQIKIIIILPLEWSIKVIKFEREHYHFIQFDYLGFVFFFSLVMCGAGGFVFGTGHQVLH